MCQTVMCIRQNNLYAVLSVFFVLFGSSQAWDDNYSVEDDAKVLPIVLPIVGVVVLACIIGCCVQGGKCNCLKRDDPNDKKLSPELQGNTLGRNLVASGHKQGGKSTRPYIQESRPLPGYSQLHGISVTKQSNSYNNRPLSRPPTRSQTLAKATDRHQNGQSYKSNGKTASREVVIGIQTAPSSRAPRTRSSKPPGYYQQNNNFAFIPSN